MTFAMRQLLTSRFGFEERNAVLLINEQATRQAITAAWHGLTEQTQAGDTVFIQYSGHGSQMATCMATKKTAWMRLSCPMTPVTQAARCSTSPTMRSRSGWMRCWQKPTTWCSCSTAATRPAPHARWARRRCPPRRGPDPRPAARRVSGARSVDVVEHGPGGWFPPNERLVFIGCCDNEESNEHRA
ncbi:MAG: caspase family protein [Anaerolineae bacterium]|nr:caspase family protein [Anaerolineae bacterium]